ncbi:hypothetical protein AAFF_G00032250 [Aldrovandia affinis]|uniref:Uncharacterized protein n=1 Tax=Aldrovandia affinis TaxID=143900 RepID=A0AAD7S3X5_9TELE|nr:hypothetical protein AAFF_G00032250 [Aldrovandia affinis]
MVIKANSLQLADRLDASEQTWAKAAKHFTALLTAKDEEGLSRILKLTGRWKDEVAAFTRRLSDCESRQCEEIQRVQAGIVQWQRFCETSISSPDVKLEKESQDKLSLDLKQWASVLTVQCERYGGEDLLSCRETLDLLAQLQEDWVDMGLRLFRRHPGPAGEAPRGQETMRELGGAVSELHTQLETRVTGESGVHILLISLIGGLELWATRLKAVSGRPGGLPRGDWLTLEKDLGGWTKLVEEALLRVSSTQTESDRARKVEHNRIEIDSVFVMLRDFLSTQDTFFYCENQRLCGEASSIHSALMHWMVDLLLLTVPDRSDPRPDADRSAPGPDADRSDPRPDARALVTVSLQQLEEDGRRLTQRLEHFSKYLANSCLAIDEADLQKPQAEEECESELVELNRLQRACAEWGEACQTLLSEVKGGAATVWETETVDSQSDTDSPPSAEASEDSVGDEDREPPSEEEEDEEEEEGGRGWRGACGSKSSRVSAAPLQVKEESSEPVEKYTERPSTQRSVGPDGSVTEDALVQENVLPAGTGEVEAPSQTPDAQKALDALGKVEALELQLLGAEGRVQRAEEHAQRTEGELQAALERIQELEVQLKEARASREHREDKEAETVTPRADVPPEPKTASQQPESRPKQRSVAKKRLPKKPAQKQPAQKPCIVHMKMREIKLDCKSVLHNKALIVLNTCLV